MAGYLSEKLNLAKPSPLSLHVGKLRPKAHSKLEAEVPFPPNFPVFLSASQPQGQSWFGLCRKEPGSSLSLVLGTTVAVWAPVLCPASGDSVKGPLPPGF